MGSVKRKKPKICGQCIYYENGFCWLDEDKPTARYYNEVACNLGISKK